MARPTKSQVRAINETASLFRWHASFTDPPSAVTVPDDLNLYLFSTAIPKKSAGQSVEIKIRGHTIKRPGVYDDEHTLQLQFIETVDNRISTFLKSWRDALSHPDTGVQQPLESVTSTFQIIRLDNQDNPIWKYELKGCFLEDYEPAGGELGADGGDIMRPTLTLSYDWFEDGPV